MKKISLILFLLLLIPFLSGCGTRIKAPEPIKSAQTEVLNYVTTTGSMSETTTTKVVATSSAKSTNNLNKKNSMDNFDPNKQYLAEVHTSSGDFTITFNLGQTPKTVENFVTLARKRFYDKTIFHRVIKGFMIQGGDPLGNGTGGPGYKFDDEKFDGQYTRGTVAMANSGPNTNGSQFFVMQADYPLPPNYVIFGKVTSGMDTVDKIATAEVKPGMFGEASTPANPVVIKSVEIK